MTICGNMLDLIPKPPPISGGIIKRNRFSGIFSAAADTGCMVKGPWKLDQTVIMSSAGSYSAMTAKVSIGVEEYLGNENLSLTITSA